MTESEFYKKVTITWEHVDCCNQDMCRATMTCCVTGGIDHEMPEEAKSYIEEILKRRLHDFMLDEFGGRLGNDDLRKAYMMGYEDSAKGWLNPERAVR